MTDEVLLNSPLGKSSVYKDTYAPDLLYAIPRLAGYKVLGISEPLPFEGYDIWNAYELSWLNSKGKPVVAIGEFIIPCQTPNLVESKSLKLYLNSFSMQRFDTMTKVQQLIKDDLSQLVGGDVKVNIHLMHEISALTSLYTITQPAGLCVDTLDIDCEHYNTNAGLLQFESNVEKQVLYSHAMGSKCLVTAQPDWGTVIIESEGPRIVPESFLRYIVSFRNHQEFHEQCAERIFMDIMRLGGPRELSVSVRYTRRGGIDINPFRSTKKIDRVMNQRTVRQ